MICNCTLDQHGIVQDISCGEAQAYWAERNRFGFISHIQDAYTRLCPPPTLQTITPTRDQVSAAHIAWLQRNASHGWGTHHGWEAGVGWALNWTTPTEPVKGTIEWWADRLQCTRQSLMDGRTFYDTNLRYRWDHDRQILVVEASDGR